MKNKLLILVLLFSVSALFAQETAIGEWRTHLPYGKVIDVAVAGNIVYAATPYNMFIYNTDDNRVQRLDKVKGLHDVGISKIGYNKKLKILLVAYTNANMDLIDNSGNITNITDIRDKEILGNKTINNIMFIDDYAYLSCGFGIVVFDMVKQEVKDTYYIGPDGDAINVLDMTVNDTSLFAATESGIYYADKNALNLVDFKQWHKEMRLNKPSIKYNIVEAFGGKVYANYLHDGFEGDTMYVFDGNGWNYFEPGNNSRHTQINAEGDKMLIATRYKVKVYDSNADFLYDIWNPSGNKLEPLAARTDDKGNVWIGDNKKGMVKTWNEGWSGEIIQPNGPGTKNVYALDAEGTNVWVAPGGRQSNWSKLYMLDGIFSFIDEKWTTFNYKNTEALDTINDFVCVKVDPQNHDIAYVGSWHKGVLKFVNNELITVYSVDNSTLRPWIAAPNQINISGLAYDSYHNLWVANTGAPDILSMMNDKGEWRSFNLGGQYSGIDIGKMMIDNNNYKWIVKRKEGFLLVFNDNGTFDNASDDQVKVLSSSSGQGGIPGNGVYSFATDQNGEVWVGTDKGVAVFSNSQDIFTPGVNFDAHQILVPRNDGSGLADILLETELVTAITVDGANRKWIGTERAGVFLLSPDGLKEIHHFTTENSPLLSNNITDITIDANGEVFIGTANGLISYRSTATPGNPTNTGVYAYPNPVRENYSGLIAIKNIVSNASVKITDSYGNLVYETKAEGGQAVWNGKNFDGRRVATGVYVVFITNNDGTETMATKILIIR